MEHEATPFGNETRHVLRRLWWLLPLFAYLLVYLRAVGFERVWDDVTWFASSGPLSLSLVEGLTTSNTDLIDGGADRVPHASYRPLTYLTFWIDRNILDAPFAWFHLHNILAGLLYLPLWSWLGRERSWSLAQRLLVGPLFLLHPIHTEVIAYVSGRPDLLAGLAATATLALALKREPNRVRWLLVGLMMVGTLFFKEGSIGLGLCAASILAVDGRKRDALTALVVLSVAVLVYFGVRMSFVGAVDEAAPVAAALWALPGLSLQLLASFLAPLDLAVARPPTTSLAPLGWALTTVAVVLVSLRLIRRPLPAWAQSAAWLAAGWLSWVALIGPSAVVALEMSALGDRYAHAASMPLVLCGAEALGPWIRQLMGRRLGPILLGGVALFGVGALLAVSWLQVGFWRDNETLFRRAVAVAPNDGLANCTLGATLAEKRRFNVASYYLEQGAALVPWEYRCWNNLGVARMQMGHFEESAAALRRSLQVSAGQRATPLLNLAKLQFLQDDTQRGCVGLQLVLALESHRGSTRQEAAELQARNCRGAQAP